MAANPPLRRGWIEVRVAVPDGWGELVAAELALDGCTSVAFGRPNLAAPAAPAGSDYVRTFYAQEDDGDALRGRIAAGLASLAERAEAPELAGLRPSFHALPPEDWAQSWRKTWRPFRVGRLEVVTRDWPRPLRAGDRRLRLEPGGTFGTGRHATTRLCLLALQELELDGARVLDAGCGSGILSAAAALGGAAAVLGFDVDPRTPREAAELCADNGVGERCTFRVGDFSCLGPGDSDFDLVLANIYADVIQAHAADLRGRLAPDGRFLFSGCLDRHRGATVEALVGAGFALEEVRQRGRWLALLGRRA
jgi:ribosomal protein L11 methyltransferase